MLRRFCLYGFLKNQQYYDMFLLLAFIEKGLTYTAIGMLVGFRELCINLMEVPTGAIADVLGRRRAMICSFLAYNASFLMLAFAVRLPLLFAAMFLFSIGDAFRTGTHKAMIFDWLARQGRAEEKTKVYGLTRSWSKIGSAVSAVIAAILVFTTGSYSHVFLFCLIPYTANIINFLTYPAYLDGPRQREVSSQDGVLKVLWTALHESIRSRRLRRLFAESMGFEGVFKVAKDYIQPILQAAALSLPLLLGCTGLQRTAVLVGAVGFVMYMCGSFASRHAASLVRLAGSEHRSTRWLWCIDVLTFAALTAAILAGMPGLAVACFVWLTIIQNFWRPILISRFAEGVDNSRTATVLSMESQAKTLFAALLAPLLGMAVDWMPDDLTFLPVGIVGFVVAAGMLATMRREPAAERG